MYICTNKLLVLLKKTNDYETERESLPADWWVYPEDGE